MGLFRKRRLENCNSLHLALLKLEHALELSIGLLSEVEGEALLVINDILRKDEIRWSI